MIWLVIGVVVQCTTLEIQEFMRGWKVSKWNKHSHCKTSILHYRS